MGAQTSCCCESSDKDLEDRDDPSVFLSLVDVIDPKKLVGVKPDERASSKASVSTASTGVPSSDSDDYENDDRDRNGIDVHSSVDLYRQLGGADDPNGRLRAAPALATTTEAKSQRKVRQLKRSASAPALECNKVPSQKSWNQLKRNISKILSTDRMQRSAVSCTTEKGAMTPECSDGLLQGETYMRDVLIQESELLAPGEKTASKVQRIMLAMKTQRLTKMRRRSTPKVTRSLSSESSAAGKRGR